MVAEIRALDDAARGLPPLSAPDGMIDRIRAERATGSRVILPAADGARPPPRVLRPGVAIAAAAGFVLALIVGFVDFSRSDADRAAVATGMEGDCMSPETLRQMLLSSGLVLATACAQEVAAPPDVPSLSAGELIASRIEPGRWTYRSRWLEDGVPGGWSRHETSYMVEPVGLAGAPAWRAVATWETSFGGQLTDTTHLTRDRLTPLHQVRAGHHTWAGSPRVIASRSFTADSVLGVWHQAGNRDLRIAARAPSFPFAVSEHHVLLLVRAAPITETAGGYFPYSWLGVGVTVVTPDGLSLARQRPLQFSYRVRGRERVTVPAGGFECWVLEVSTWAGRSETWWVDVDHQWLIKAEQASTSGGPVRQVALSAWTAGD